jgi:phage terminase small subunit
MAELTDKQKRFCDEYLVDLNGTRAYRQVYKVKTDNTAAVNAARLLTNAKIQTYIQQKQKKLQEKTGITIERVLNEYARIAFSDLRALYNEDGSLKKINELTEEEAAAIAGVEVDELFDLIDDSKTQIGITKKIKRWDKVKALDSLGRHLGMFAKDNEQLKPETVVNNVNGMNTGELKTLQELLSKVNGR